MFEIEIDGKIVNANPGENLITVTDREGISVPRFCYHNKLSVSANCRMCLVDVEGATKPQPACSTPVSNGMRVSTKNDKAKSSQKAVMEFLLINHPLDCPICDQGGECELQDVAMSYSSDVSRFNEGKRVIADSDIGPLIQTDMTRCIHCTRCVRFGAEIAGIMEMGGTGRGDSLKIEPFLQEGIQSELSGNMIDLCPVGALTSKPFRYELRSWQMNAVEGIARHDSVGSNIHIQTYKGKVKRVVARNNDNINETWISDRDRFSCDGLNHENRLQKPQIKYDGVWKETEWDTALVYSSKALLREVIDNKEESKLGALASNNATLEEYYLLRKLLKQVGSDNTDYRLNIKDLSNTINLDSNIKIKDIENIDYALLVGSYTRLEQPMINHRLRKSSLNGATIDVINSMSFNYNLPINSEYILNSSQIANLLARTLKAILLSKEQEIPGYLDKFKVSDADTQLANKLLSSDKSAIILGEHLINSDNSSNIANLISIIAEKTSSSTLNLSETGNSIAAKSTGFVPNENGLDANEMLASKMNAYILLDVYPKYDFHNSVSAINALRDEKTFVIALNSFKDSDVFDYADVILPISSYYETSGTHTNVEGEMQSFSAAVGSPKDIKPAWKVLKVLADLLDLSGFNYTDSSKVTSEAKQQIKQNIEHDREINLINTKGVEIIWQPSPYSTDALLRHSNSLQATKIGQLNTASMSASTAKSLKLSDTDNYLGVPVVISEVVADKCVFISSSNETISEKIS